MSSDSTCVIVGASHAGSQLALQLRKEGWEGRIVLIGDETVLPYHRPPLSKQVLAGDKQVEDMLLRPEAMYTKNQIELRLGERVMVIHPQQKTVLLSGGETLSYERLALCTGSRPLHLPLGEKLSGVHYLRNAGDVTQIRNSLPGSKKAVIIGAGYIGLEAAAVLAGLGLQVTVLERAPRVLQRVTSEQMSQFIQQLHAHHGVEIQCNAEVISINGASTVESVSCADGTVHRADLVIIGIGVVPEETLAETAGLRIENGIWVDEYCRSSDENIFAAGDCTSHPSALYKRRIRLESVQNANDQARVAAAGICGKELVYDHVPWFWSDQYDIKLQSAGLSEQHDEVVLTGEATVGNPEGFSLLYFLKGRLVAADCVNRAKDFMLCKRLIPQGADKAQVLGQL